MRKLILIALILQGCGNQSLNQASSPGPCSGSQVGTWSNIALNNVLTLNSSCTGSTTYCNEVFTYQAINSTTYTLTVSATNGGPECLPIGPTVCTANFITADVLAIGCGGGKNLTTNHNRQ